MTAAFLIMALSAGATVQPDPPKRLECRFELGGVVDEKPTIFELVGKDMFATQTDGSREKISTEAPGRVDLSAETPEQAAAYSNHSRNGDVVTLNHYSAEKGKEPVLMMSVTYDFGRGQVVIGEMDQCVAAPK